MDFPRLSLEQRSSLETATARYQAALPGSPAISFLEARGIPEHVALGNRLGFVVEAEQGHEQYTGRLSIPFVTPTGVAGLRFRALGESDAKYLQPAGSGTHLYNVLDLHRTSDYVAVCEGELDALVMSALVGVPAVAITGVGGWEPFHRRLFGDYDKVFICMDPDDAGRKAAHKLRSELSNGVVIDLEIGDVNETFLAKGPEFIKEKLGV